MKFKSTVRRARFTSRPAGIGGGEPSQEFRRERLPISPARHRTDPTAPQAHINPTCRLPLPPAARPRVGAKGRLATARLGHHAVAASVPEALRACAVAPAAVTQAGVQTGPHSAHTAPRATPRSPKRAAHRPARELLHLLRRLLSCPPLPLNCDLGAIGDLSRGLCRHLRRLLRRLGLHYRRAACAAFCACCCAFCCACICACSAICWRC